MQAKVLDFKQSLKHYAAIHPKKYYKQPVSYEMGIITNAIKEMGYAKPYTTKQLIQKFGAGYCAVLSNFEIDDKNNFRFISASAFAVDIDDDGMITDPLNVLQELKDICVGLFYTFSHGKKGNRYRLFFQLDKSITDLDDYAALIDYVMFYLKNRNLPVDGMAKSPTQIIRGGNSGFEVNNFAAAMPVDEWLPKAKVYADLQKQIRAEEHKKRAASLNESLLQSVTYEELKEMCEAIGYIASGQGEEVTRKWLQIVYALKHETIIGNLDEQEGFELYSIISGSEANERYWNSIKPRGDVKIGTVIAHAKAAGHKRKHNYNYALQEAPETIPVEVLKVKQYLTPEIAKTLVKRNQSLLVDSPTGSRKTSSFVQAFKELANKDYHYYIFAAPTIPLTEQVAKENNIFCVTGATKNLRNRITTEAVHGVRVFVCTYDKTAEIIRHLEQGIDYDGSNPKFTVVIDEIHKFTEAYSYRYAAIDQIKDIAGKAQSFIGISGTLEDVLKDDFDSLVKVDTGDSKSKCLDYRVFTYKKRDDADVMLIPVIRGLLKQTKVLLFINSKKRIERIKNLLRMEGIKTQVVTSDSKQSPTYLNIVENRTIADDIDVLISTTVLADGVSIDNGLNWSCVVVSDMASPLFNPSTVRQISNRFRNYYRYFALYMMQPNPEKTETHKFNIESEYQYRTKIVSSYVEYLNQEFDDYSQFVPAGVEQKNGIFYKSTEENAIIEYNPLFVRHESMKRKEKYYFAFRNAFIQEVSRQLGIKCNGIFNVNEEVEKNGSDLSSIFETVEALQEQEKKENDELRAAFKDYFDESIYQAFLKDDSELLEVFKNYVHPEQVAAIRRIIKIADFETCCKIGQAIKRKADVNKFHNHIKALADIAYFENVTRKTVTKKVYEALLKMAGETFASSDFKDITENKLPKKLKVQPKDVKEALQLFNKSSRKSNSTVFVMIEPLNLDIVADVHGITEAAIKNSLFKYACTKNGHQQKILMPAIQKKWGIETYQK